MDKTVIICVGDKRYNIEIKTMCKYSSLFSDLLKSLQRGDGKVPRVAASSKESKHVLLHRNTNVYEDAFVLEMIGIPSEDVKLTLDTMTTTMKDTSFTRSNLLRMLPVVKELNISHLHRRIDKELLAILNASASSSNVNMILENLQVAEIYSLSRVKEWCIGAFVLKSSAHDRNTLLKDFHISDAPKLEILNRMADAASNNYDKELKNLRDESDRTYKQIEVNRAEFVAKTDIWKKELEKRVQVVIDQNESLHKSFIKSDGFEWIGEKFDEMISSSFHEKKIFKELEQIKEQTKKLFEKLGLIKDEALEAKMAEERSKIFVNEKNYTAGGNNCTDGDEFTILNYDPCARHGTGTCVNTLGGYNFTCLVGWTGPRCQYVDENVIASDRACLRGFVNKAFNDTYAECQDIDEWSNGSTNTCGFHQHCNNTAGSYKCECDIGWEGSNCGKDIDECTRANICGINQHCIITGGSYVCLGDTANSSTTNTVDVGHMHIVHSSAYAKQNPENQQETTLDVVLGSVFGTVAFMSGFLVALSAYENVQQEKQGGI
ncbi:uncharacterized protein LOC127848040 [Dreissena polymorpha]|uniref:uncharacterized protein LOC127848040 n=1 Tax=Dreissena polymorpha TaxID=45954 RepID=UPI0022642545|nr:uncharacterized protein LOC127848040 [Dreissena polymorpha]